MEAIDIGEMIKETVMMNSRISIDLLISDLVENRKVRKRKIKVEAG